ncbi:hypothetical protein BV25DRAFT_400833 [Artomyces pyxidatus]|uniref:Uncharacterized protein n=1 Tax=Artomyces pyxidatus TaxID=48021 RepID=A0ACB8T4I4_9AGAM|nr:hypothetical protein BV25DRAFT_400833 [Artomyces pyxidatus]
MSHARLLALFLLLFFIFIFVYHRLRYGRSAPADIESGRRPSFSKPHPPPIPSRSHLVQQVRENPNYQSTSWTQPNRSIAPQIPPRTPRSPPPSLARTDLCPLPAPPLARISDTPPRHLTPGSFAWTPHWHSPSAPQLLIKPPSLAERPQLLPPSSSNPAAPAPVPQHPPKPVSPPVPHASALPTPLAPVLPHSSRLSIRPSIPTLPVENVDADDLRALASEQTRFMKLMFDAGREARRRGNSALAEELMKNGKLHEASKDALNAQASKLIFEEHNKKLKQGLVDLHGLYKDEAISYAEKSLAEAVDRGDYKIQFIVGQGHHSSREVVIKPAIEKMMRERGLSASIHPRNPGLLIVQLKAGRPDATRKAHRRARARVRGVAGL